MATLREADKMMVKKGWDKLWPIIVACLLPVMIGGVGLVIKTLLAQDIMSRETHRVVKQLEADRDLTMAFRVQMVADNQEIKRDVFNLLCKQDAVVKTLKDDKTHAIQYFRNLERSIEEHKRETDRQFRKGSMTEQGKQYSGVHAQDSLTDAKDQLPEIGHVEETMIYRDSVIQQYRGSLVGPEWKEEIKR